MLGFTKRIGRPREGLVVGTSKAGWLKDPAVDDVVEELAWTEGESRGEESMLGVGWYVVVSTGRLGVELSP